jgi:hypothetical protein
MEEAAQYFEKQFLRRGLIFVGILKATDEQSRIRIRIRSQCTDPRTRIRFKMSRIQKTAVKFTQTFEILLKNGGSKI